VHIPLFPPDDEKGKRELFLAMARKVGLKLAPADVPELPFSEPSPGTRSRAPGARAPPLRAPGGRATRRELPAIIAEVVDEFRPSAHTVELELMDLLAVRECTDDRFLPARFRDLGVAKVEARIRELELSRG